MSGPSRRLGEKGVGIASYWSGWLVWREVEWWNGAAWRSVESWAAHSKTEWPAHDSTDTPRLWRGKGRRGERYERLENRNCKFEVEHLKFEKLREARPNGQPMTPPMRHAWRELGKGSKGRDGKRRSE